MSIRALHSAASGMDANQFSLDTIANNLANASTTAFKRSRANFEELFYEHLKLPGALDAAGNPTPIGVSVGLGTRISGTDMDLANGSFMQTDQPLDVAIAGSGYFQVIDGNGETLYARNGNFTLNANGDLVLASADSGRLVEPNINIPQGATEITITDDGRVTYKEPGASTITEAGQISLAQFTNPGGLLRLGDTLYSETDASGTAVIDFPGNQGLGVVKQGFLEASNVEPVRELVDLIKTQRHFELNSQTLQAADQMLQLISNLRRM